MMITSTTRNIVTPISEPGSRRICYINFAEHLLNAYNPNMSYPDLGHRWSDADWFRYIDMIGDFGFTHFEFWLVPRLFSRDGLDSSAGHEFTRQLNAITEHAATVGVGIDMLCSLTTVGADWHTHCPNVPAEWSEVRYLWDEWTLRLSGLDVVSIFPGDPGGCSRNGCTAETYIDRSVEISEIIRRNIPTVEIELGTWGSPFWGWGTIEGPPGWQGEFIAEYQHTAWRFDRERADRSMEHLIHRLPDFPSDTSVAINMGFGCDGDPTGEADARHWAHEIAKTNRIHTWDFSLTEGENAVFPHWRFDRLFAQRREERDAAPYSGGICFTMTPLLNQLSLFESAQSFINPNGDPVALAGDFFERYLGSGGREVVQYLPLFEAVPDWGHYVELDIPREELHRKMSTCADLLGDLAGTERTAAPLLPDVATWRAELQFFARLFADLTASSPDRNALRSQYWNRVYSIWDHLPDHVDPRPRRATDNFIDKLVGFGG
jgi:hypothetical protein